MTDVLHLLLLTALACTGLHVACMWDSMILELPARWVAIYLPWQATMPLFGCLTCMASLWGTAAWWVWAAAYSPLLWWEAWLGWLPFVLALAGLNTLIKEAIYASRHD
jgi:hypothetical protein